MTSDTTACDAPWPWRGGPEHSRQMGDSQECAEKVQWIHEALSLLEFILRSIEDSANSNPSVNEVAALACYTRAFRSIRAATILAVEGLYPEAVVYSRDIYESAGLARLLAKRPDKAEDWMRRERWVKEGEVRQIIENMGISPTGEDSPYRVYYKNLSDVHHPTSRACIPLIADADADRYKIKLESVYVASEANRVLHGVAVHAMFALFTVLNAAVDRTVVPIDWREAVNDLAHRVMIDQDLSHLEVDVEKDRSHYSKLQAAILDDAALEDYLRDHPNSFRNVRARSDANSLED